MTDFTIIAKPVAIKFECPFCEEVVELPLAKANPPSYWGDEWDDVKCPNCGEMVSLGDYGYD